MAVAHRDPGAGLGSSWLPKLTGAPHKVDAHVQKCTHVHKLSCSYTHRDVHADMCGAHTRVGCRHRFIHVLFARSSACEAGAGVFLLESPTSPESTLCLDP